MKQKEINFNDLMELNFERGYMNDAVFQRQFGYDDFWVQFKLNKRFTIEWEHSTRKATLLRFEKLVKGKADEGVIEERISIENLAEVKKYMYIFGHLTKSEAGILEEKDFTTSIIQAA